MKLKVLWPFPPLLLSSVIALAVPTAYPARPGQLFNVSNPTTSTVLGDSDDPSLGYVLPPSVGTVAPAGLSGLSANMGFCKEMAELRGMSESLTLAIAKENSKLAGFEPAFQAKQEAYEKAQAAAAAVITQSTDIQQIDDLGTAVVELQQRIESLSGILGSCEDMNRPKCAEALDEIKSTQGELVKSREELAKLRQQTRADLTAYNRAKAAVRVAKEAMNATYEPIDAVKKQIAEARAQLSSFYSRFAQMEGAFSAVRYDSGWDENVAILRDTNPTYRFERINTRAVKVNATVLSRASKMEYLASLPQVLDYSVNGKVHLPYAGSPESGSGEDTLDSFPSEMEIDFRLNLLGACPIAHPDWFNVDKDLRGAPLMSISATYEYPAAFYTRVTFSYDLDKIFDHMERVTHSSGFFSSHDYHDIVETPFSRDEFSTDWRESDPDHLLSEGAKNRIETQVKAELVARVLRDEYTLQPGALSQPLSLPVPEHGAMVLARGLDDACGSISFYCAAGSFVLKGLDAIFGHNDRMDHFHREYHGQSIETWNRQTARWVPGTTVFVIPDKTGAIRGLRKVAI